MAFVKCDVCGLECTHVYNTSDFVYKGHEECLPLLQNDPFLKDVNFGKLLIRNVPHVVTNIGLKRKTSIEINLHALIEFMEKKELTTFNYQDWGNDDVNL